MKTKSYPFRLNESGESVTIYSATERGARMFTVAYTLNGERVKLRRANEATAHRDAKAALTMLLNRAPVFAESTDAGEFREAKKLVADLGGLSVDDVCRKYAKLMRAFDGGDVTEALAMFKKNKPLRTDKFVKELVADYNAEIKGALSYAYASRTRDRLLRFAASFGERLIHTITLEELEKWLAGLAVASRTWNNERGTLLAFFNWSKARKFLPRGIEVEASFMRVLAAPVEVKIFTLADAETLMARVEAERPEWVPYAAIGLFAGVRPGELARLGFESAIRWDHGHIEIKASESKTGDRRFVPMAENLQTWLAPFAAKTGKIAVNKADQKLSAFARNIVGLEWPKDVMRHSFISYAVAREESVGRVAMWAGNSESIIKRHYLEVVKKPVGEAFGRIVPAGSAKVAHFKKAAWETMRGSRARRSVLAL